MKLTLTSIKKKVLELDNIEKAIIPTASWEITILDTHEPLISALKPGILRIKYSWKEDFFAIWWWVLETDGISLNITADMIDDWTHLNLEEIQDKKKQAKELMEKYREENEIIDIDKLIDLEMQFLKESAKEQLALR